MPPHGRRQCSRGPTRPAHRYPMPVLAAGPDGWEVTRRLRSVAVAASAPAVTGSAPAAHLELAGLRPVTGPASQPACPAPVAAGGRAPPVRKGNPTGLGRPGPSAAGRQSPRVRHAPACASIGSPTRHTGGPLVAYLLCGAGGSVLASPDRPRPRRVAGQRHSLRRLTPIIEWGLERSRPPC